MGSPVTYELAGRVARIGMDDGKVNVVSIAMQAALHEALDRAERDAAAVVQLRGRDGVFSAGFDLAVFQRGDGEASRAMVIGGFELARRLLAFPRPVLMVSTGHAIAMGAFLLLSGDYRLASSAPARITANEVAIGLTMPRSAIEILRHRLTKAALSRALLLAEAFAPAAAREAGFVDELVAPDELDRRAHDLGDALARLDLTAHEQSKQRYRERMLRDLDAAIEVDRADLGRAFDSNAAA